MAGSNEPKKTINAVSTAFQIVETLQELRGAGVTEIADAVGVSKGTAYNHLVTLEDAHYVVKNDDNTYDVSLKFLDVAHDVRRRFPIVELVETEVDELAAESEEMALFTVAEHGQGICLYVAYGERSVQTPLYVGHRSDLHTTAVGKAILAHMSPADVERIIEERGLAAVTEHTITDRDRLFDELELIRERGGIAFNREETIHGLVGVGAPITYHDGEVAGAISIIGPASRMDGPRLERELPEMIERSVNIIEVNSTSL